MESNILFHSMKLFVSSGETLRFNLETNRHVSILASAPSARSFALLVNEFGYFCIMISRKT